MTRHVHVTQAFGRIEEQRRTENIEPDKKVAEVSADYHEAAE